MVQLQVIELRGCSCFRTPVIKQPMQFIQARAHRVSVVVAYGLLALFVFLAGCHDGPMYAIKRANPVYSLGQWKADERLGPTDATRAEELKTLLAQIDSMSPAEQERWLGELDKIMEHDNSAYMRGLAIRAAGRAGVAESISVIEKGLEDDDFKVRMVAASALAGRQEPRAVELLAKTVNSESNKDVRLAAIKSLGTHRGQTVTETLKLALQEPELAYRYAAIASLKDVTGKDLGNESAVWVAMLEGESSEAESEEQQQSKGPGDLF